MAPARLTPSLRSIIRRPVLSTARLITVAVVVAAIAAVTAIAAATLFRRLPYPHADRLVQIYLLSSDTTDLTQSMALYPVVFNHLDARGASIDDVAGIWQADRAVGGRGEPESVTAGRVTANFFSMLGASISVGRTFTDDEVQADAPVVVLSHGLWTRMFGADQSVVGQTLQIDRRPHTVIGVTARGFDPAFTPTQFWTPLRVRDAGAVRATVVQTIGRMRVGATAAAATSELGPVLDAARAEVPDLIRGHTIGALDLRESRYGSRRNALLMMLAIVAGLALIATANLANLTFADLASRLSDVALRAALGGSTRAVVVEEVLPCAILAGAGSIVGLWMASTAAPWMLSLDSSLATAGIAIAVDWRVALAGVTGALAVMAAAVAIPSWRIARRDQLSMLGSPRTTEGRGGRIRAMLVGLQTAMALVLLSAAGMVAATVQRTTHVDPGFDRTNVVTGQLRLADDAFPDHAARVRFIRAVLDRLHDTPGVVDAGTTLNLFNGGGTFSTNVSVEDAPRPDGQSYGLQYRRVSPGYFKTMKIRLLRGRPFAPTDTDATPLVAVVSDSFARQFWPSGNAIGRRIKRGPANAPWAEIIGVVADVRDGGLNQATGPVMYTSYYQGSAAATPAGLVVRTAGDPRAAIAQIKQAVWAVDPSQPLSNIVILDDYLRASLGPQQLRAWLAAACSGFGILLAVIGIYGVTARSVSERTKEVGIRIALGGDPSSVWWRLVVASLRAVSIGAAIGVATSMAVDAGITRLLPELGGGDWVVRAGSAVIMIVAGAIASIVAARHAAAIEPMRALRGE